MGFLEFTFPVSGVTTSLLWPPLVAMTIAFFTSMGGLSGAFLILPFMMSIYGFVTPSASATNFVYNVVSIPSGVYGYIKEGRMNWSLAIFTIVTTVPGLLIGYYMRVLWLPDPASFKVFVGFVLLFVALRMLYDARKPSVGKHYGSSIGRIRALGWSGGKIGFEFGGRTYRFGVVALGVVSFLVGIIGGAYGIGGGAVIAPFCVAVLGLPIYAVAGATLLSTFVASVVGVIFYSHIPFDASAQLSTGPDWLLGGLFGVGGFVGMYFGSRAQRHVPQRVIKIILGVLILLVAIKYLVGHVLGGLFGAGG